MLEGKPRESLVLYDSPTEVSLTHLFLFHVFIRSRQVLILMTLLRRTLAVSYCSDSKSSLRLKI